MALRYRGIVEQKQSLKKAIALTIQRNWTLVLPHWRLRGSQTGATPQEPLTALIDAKSFAQLEGEGYAHHLSLRHPLLYPVQCV